MLKTTTISPTQPPRAKTRWSPSFVLGSIQSSTYLARGTSCLGSSGWVEASHASGFCSPAASFETILSSRVSSK